jgi:cardiolipin synthase
LPLVSGSLMAYVPTKPPNQGPPLQWDWLQTGDHAFAAMEQAIQLAQHSVNLETYIYTDSPPGQRIRNALVQAAQRGVRVRTLIDSFGSLYLPDSFWNDLRAAGGLVRWFNPLSLHHFNIRNHRKLLVVDNSKAFIGGFNITDNFTGDGIHQGWRDLGLILHGPAIPDLNRSFDTLFQLADFRHRKPRPLQRPLANRKTTIHGTQVITSGPGRPPHPVRQQLRTDLRHAKSVKIISAYFLPPGRLLRALQRISRRGGSVQLILPGKSDVPLLQSATRGLYGRLLRSHVQIAEYQPQILHTKFILIDQALYLGSANLDRRSLGINYELLVRFTHPDILHQALHVFNAHTDYSQPITRQTWQKSRTLWERLKSRLACTLFARLDPHVTRQQLQTPK